MSGYTIIDVDTHVTESPDLWTSRAPEKMRDRVPHVQTDKDGRLSWFVGGESLLANPGMTATAGRGNMQNPPKNYEEMHPGAHDAQERLKYMDQMGIWAMVMYPNVGGFGAQEFLKLNDPELMLTCVQIYNDWQDRMGLGRRAALAAYHLAALLGCRCRGHGNPTVCQHGTPRNPVHRRAAVLGPAPAWRPALESPLGGVD